MKTRSKSAKKPRTLAKTYKGKPALYIGRPGQCDVDGPWCAKYDTEWGIMLERKHTDPSYQGEPEYLVLRNHQRSIVLDAAEAQALIDRTTALDAGARPEPGDYVAIVWDRSLVKHGFVVKTTPHFAEVLMEDGSTSSRWECGWELPKKKSTRTCKIENMMVLSRAGDV